MKTLTDIEVLEGVRVLVRCDFNVPIENGAVRDDFRIRVALPTIDLLREKGAKVILISHIESNDSKGLSLEPISAALNKLGQPVVFLKDYKKAHGYIEHEMQNGQVLLLENLRFFPGEKANDRKFAEELASLADIYVNEAFPVSHRAHASIVGVPSFLPSYAGIQFEKEVTNLSKAFNAPHPFLFILGGAKFETKLPLLNKFMDSADAIFVGGALANDLFKKKGFETGMSLVSKGDLDLASFIASPKLLIPIDVITDKKETKAADGASPTDKILDAGPKTLELLQQKIHDARFILWNGPLGMYEDGYTGPTLELAKMVSEVTVRGAETIVGGGDTLAAIETLNIQDKFTFISSGGGAMLNFLAKGTLLGIEALEHSQEG